MMPSLATPEPEQGYLQGYATVHSWLNGEKCLIADVPIAAGTELCAFSALAVLESPNYLTLQVGVNKHILLNPPVLQYINHSCEPNVFFDTSAMLLLALKDIKPKEELKFFYPSTEWEMDRSFICNCHASTCLGIIRGARFIPKNILAKHRLTGFIQQQMATSGLENE